MLELRYASYFGIFLPVSTGPCERFAGARKHQGKTFAGLRVQWRKDAI